jgi:hypothetical protein
VRRYKVLAASTVGLMLLATAAIADQAEGDFAAGGTSADVVEGEAISLDASLFIVRAGIAAKTVTWTGPTFSGVCAGIAATPSPAGFEMPVAWASASADTLSRVFDPLKQSPVSIHGVAGAAGSDCKITYTGSATGFSTAGQPMPPGQRTVTFTVNFVGPTAPPNTPPVVDALTGPAIVDESGTEAREYTFSFTDPDEDEWTFADGYPKCGDHGLVVGNSAEIDQETKAGSFSCIFDDGLAEETLSTVAVLISDGTDDSEQKTLEVEVLNVAPTATLTRVGPANVFTGATVTYNASATDPSATDTETGFTWSFNGGEFSEAASATSQLQQTYNSCEAYVEEVEAKDKDGGVSDPASVGVSVYDGGWHGAIKPAMRNMVQKGRVVPVQIRVGCEGERLTGLTPKIQLIAGDLDPGTEPNDEAVLIATSVSGADTTGEMRPTDDGYIYNLQIPNNATAGQKFTVRVRPWGSDGAALTALLEIRR